VYFTCLMYLLKLCPQLHGLTSLTLHKCGISTSQPESLEALTNLRVSLVTQLVYL
jgi:hypothetical protein